MQITRANRKKGFVSSNLSKCTKRGIERMRDKERERAGGIGKIGAKDEFMYTLKKLLDH